MLCFVLMIILINRVYGCVLDANDSLQVLYSDGEILNLTLREEAYPDDVEVSSMSGLCSSPMKVVPDQYLNDTVKKYVHLKLIQVPMTAALHQCTYQVRMRSRSACWSKPIVRFALQLGRAAAAQCPVAVALRWRDDLSARLAAETWFECDPEQALCEQRNYLAHRDIVLHSEHVIVGTEYSRKVHLNLRAEDFAQNVSSFVCQAVSECWKDNVTVTGRLVSVPSRAAAAALPFRVGDKYSDTCPLGHWIIQTHVIKTLINKTFTKKLKKEDNGMKLICAGINCEAFASNRTCYKTILKEVTFRLKAELQWYGVIVGAVGVSLAAVCVVFWAAVARRCAAPRAVSRRPRMPTPPPERPPRHQPYYTVPFERPMLEPRRD